MKALVLLLAVGCANRANVDTLHTANGARVTAELPDGRIFPGTVDVRSQGTVVVSVNGVVVPSNSLREVVRKRRGRGALQGAGIGVLVGGTLGAIAGYYRDDKPCPPGDGCLLNFDDNGKDGAIFTGAILGFTGAIVGAIVGAVRGRDVYTTEIRF